MNDSASSSRCRQDHRQRQQLAEHADDDERQGRTGGQPDHRAYRGEQDHLQVDREDVAAGGASALNEAMTSRRRRYGS